MRARMICVAVALAAALPAQDAANPFQPWDPAAFEAHARSLGADDAAIGAWKTACGETSTAAATDELLLDLVEAYGAAVELAEDGDPRAALALAELIGSSDDYVRAHARYHLGRVFIDSDDPDKAVEILGEFLQKDRNRTPLDSEVAFFYGTALAEVPHPGHAARAFGDFLELFPTAPERYRAVALQRRAELESQFQNPLHEVADSMKTVGRDLRRTDTGDETQEKQTDIVTKLEKIIEEIEKRERQGGGSPSGNQQSSSPAENSAAPPGAHRVGNLHDVPGVADRWGDMRDRDRKAIESDVQTKLPGRYRKLLEDYYKRLGRGNGQ